MKQRKILALILGIQMAVFSFVSPLMVKAVEADTPPQSQQEEQAPSAQPEQSENTLPQISEETQPSQTQQPNAEPTEAEQSETAETEPVQATEPAATENKTDSLNTQPDQIRVISTKACSGDKNQESKHVIDHDTDTFWMSKDKHEGENRHFWECRFDKAYALSGAVFTLGRRSKPDAPWGFVPDNLKVEVLLQEQVVQTIDETSVTEITEISFPEGTKADGLRVSFADAKSKGFSIREAQFKQAQDTQPDPDAGKTPYQEKKVYADYHGPRYTREHDGNLGNWSFAGTAKNSKTENQRAVRNGDLIGADGSRDLAAAAYPLVGMQSQMDPYYQEYQILLAKMANIDGFFIEWGFPGHGTDAQLDIMMEVAEKYDFEIGVNWCDAWHLKDWITKIKPHVVTREQKVEEAVNSFGTILDKLYASPVGATFDGHPVVYLFGGFEKNEWNKIATEVTVPPVFADKTPWVFRRASMSGKINGEGKVDFSYAGKSWHDVLDGPFGWVPDRVRNAVQDGIPGFDVYGTTEDALHYLETLKQTFIANEDIPLRNSVVSPGMDNRPCAGWGDKFKYLDRDDGRLYEEMWKYNVENRAYFNTVYIASWNDYTEGHQIEPTVEDGYRELKTTQEYARQFKGEGNQDASGFELPAKLFELRKHAQHLAAVGYDMTSIQTSLDDAGQKISQGAYAQAEEIFAQVHTELEQTQQQVHTQQIIFTETENAFAVKQESRVNAAYHCAVTGNAGGEPEKAVDGISRTFWEYQGSDAYLELDLGGEKNIVCGTILTDSPFELWYQQGDTFVPAEIRLDAGFEQGIGGDFTVEGSVTAAKIRIVFANTQGKVAEVKLFENRLPAVKLLAPQDAKQVDFSKAWDIQLDAQDEDGTVADIQVYIDGVLTAPAEVQQEGSVYTLHMEPIAVQRHQIRIEVTDQEGGTTVVKPITVSPLLENVALKKPVKANTQMSGAGPELAVDGIISLESRWRTPSKYTEHWLEIDLQGSYDICQIDLYMGDATGFAVRDFQMEYWADGQWQLIPGTKFHDNNTKDLSLMFDPITTEKVRFYSTEVEGRGVRIKEIEVYAPKADAAAAVAAAADAGQQTPSYSLRNGTYLTLSDEVVQKLQDGAIEGYVNFSYMDEGDGRINISGASHDTAPFGDFTTIASIQKTGTNDWKQGRVRFTNDHLVMNHEAENDSDLVFTGEGEIRDISLEFVVSKQYDDTTPPDSGKPEEETKPGEDTKPTETTAPDEDTMPTETTKPEEENVPGEQTTPGETVKPGHNPDTGDEAQGRIFWLMSAMVLSVGYVLFVCTQKRKGEKR